MATVDTVQAGSILEGATWGGSVPGAADTGNVLHACTAPAGTFPGSLVMQIGGSIDITGAFVIGGNLSSADTGEGYSVTFSTGSSLTVNGNIVGAPGILDNSNLPVVGKNLLHVSDGKSLTVLGNVTGGAGVDGTGGGHASGEGDGAGGFISGNGGIAVSCSGAVTVHVVGNVAAGYSGSGGGGGNGYADDTVQYGGGNGGAGSDGYYAIEAGTCSGTITVDGDAQGGNAGSGGYGGTEGNYQDTYFGSGGGGGGGGGGAAAIHSGATTCAITVGGDSLGGDDGTVGAVGGGATAPGNGGWAGEGAYGVQATRATIEGDCIQGTHEHADAGQGAWFFADGGIVKGKLDGIYTNDGNKKVICYGEIVGDDNYCVVQLPTAIAATEFLYFHPDSTMVFFATGIVCECAGNVVIVKKTADTFSSDGTTEIKMMSGDAHAVGIGVTLPITAYDWTGNVVDAQYVIVGHDNYTGGTAGTFDEAARNTDPGEANVQAGVTYTICNVSKEGTAAIPDAEDVRAETPVDATAGTLDLPAEEDVKAGVKYDNNSKTGTYSAGGTTVVLFI